jgi:uncharacterized protein YjbI with pentapeptide repeats
MIGRGAHVNDHYQADLIEADLTGADLTGAISDASTRCPDG